MSKPLTLRVLGQRQALFGISEHMCYHRTALITSQAAIDHAQKEADRIEAQKSKLIPKKTLSRPRERSPLRGIYGGDTSFRLRFPLYERKATLQ